MSECVFCYTYDPGTCVKAVLHSDLKKHKILVIVFLQIKIIR